MNELEMWLLVQLREDERMLRLQDEYLNGHDRPYSPSDPADPVRALAEVEAKRQILDMIDSQGRALAAYSPGGKGWVGAVAKVWLAGDAVVRQLALPYADRPDYRDEWRA